MKFSWGEKFANGGYDDIVKSLSDTEAGEYRIPEPGEDMCPVCGKHDFQGSMDEICPVCGWVHDGVQEIYDEEGDCQNIMSLREARQAYAEGREVI